MDGNTGDVENAVDKIAAAITSHDTVAFSAEEFPRVCNSASLTDNFIPFDIRWAAAPEPIQILIA
jgi:hypothetical protein